MLLKKVLPHKASRCVLFGLMLAVFALSGCENSGVSHNGIPVSAAEKLEITVMKAGKADAMILTTDNHSVIIDCGEKDDGDDMAAYLNEKGISKVDYLFITHFDKDHVGGFPAVTDSVTADCIAVPDYIGNNGAYEKFLQALEEKNLTANVLKEDFSFSLGDVSFKVSVPKKKAYKEEDNDFSLVISAMHGNNTFLFAGDAEEERLAEVMTEFDAGFDFLKVPHHGRYNKMTERFINTVQPKYSVICDSGKNPADERTVSALKSVGSKVFSTKNGEIQAVSDGEKIEIFQ